MFHRHKINLYLCLSITFLFVGICFFSSLKEWSHIGVAHRLKGIGSIFGIGGYFLLSLSLLLSSRFKWLEGIFGGLDCIYDTHRYIGTWGFYLILFHPVFFALKWLPNRIGHFFYTFLPFHQNVTINLGSYAFWLMVIILAITFFKILPYHQWKMIHKLMGVVFILASMHIFFARDLFSSSKPLLAIPLIIGLISIAYKQIIYAYFIRFPLYQVVQLNYLDHQTIEIFLKSLSKGTPFFPGQYAFFSFHSASLSKESHPFTLCGHPNGSELSLIVKARGDFTRKLYTDLKIGNQVTVEGPFGQLNYLKAKPFQIWIAGGIGIVLFLVWARHLFALKKTVPLKSIQLFYCVHKEEDALFLDEFNRIAKHCPQFKFFLFCTDQHNRLSIKKIEAQSPHLKKSSIIMCGPKRLTRDFTAQFAKVGINRNQIEFEDFEFL
ncbi:MAG: ferric reductase-like transmembrane domain-containing protein [Simkaniaceae bacterium]|nr:ferric reductase-like transmembrane domain-containing protein [Simkaniaceae bacterium]